MWNAEKVKFQFVAAVVNAAYRIEELLGGHLAFSYYFLHTVTYFLSRVQRAGIRGDKVEENGKERVVREK